MTYEQVNLLRQVALYVLNHADQHDSAWSNVHAALRALNQAESTSNVVRCVERSETESCRAKRGGAEVRRAESKAQAAKVNEEEAQAWAAQQKGILGMIESLRRAEGKAQEFEKPS